MIILEVIELAAYCGLYPSQAWRLLFGDMEENSRCRIPSNSGLVFAKA